MTNKQLLETLTVYVENLSNYLNDIDYGDMVKCQQDVMDALYGSAQNIANITAKLLEAQNDN